MVGKGGRGDASKDNGGGGGAGAYGIKVISIVSGEVWTLTLGAGNGSISTFSNGTITLSLQDGYNSYDYQGGFGGETVTNFDFGSNGGDGGDRAGNTGGTGGASFFGGGGYGAVALVAAARPGKVYGSGGGGPSNYLAGALGATGAVIVKRR